MGRRREAEARPAAVLGPWRLEFPGEPPSFPFADEETEAQNTLLPPSPHLPACSLRELLARGHFPDSGFTALNLGRGACWDNGFCLAPGAARAGCWGPQVRTACRRARDHRARANLLPSA